MINHLHMMTDKDLARNTAHGDRAVFDEIVRRYCRPLTLFAAGRTDSLQDAEDIVQETFLRAWQNSQNFNSDCSLKTWLFTIAYRLIVSAWRKKKPQRLSDKIAVQLTDEQPPVYEYQWLWDAARKLGPDAYTALWLRYKQEMSTEEIARVMNKSKITVRVLLHRSRNRLARKIADQPDIAEQAHWLQGKPAFLERIL